MKTEPLEHLLGAFGHLIVFVRRILRPGNRDQLDLFELMLADHAASVLAGCARLRAEAGGPRRVAQRQTALVEDLAGDEISQGNLGGRDQPVTVRGAEQILGELWELAGPE